MYRRFVIDLPDDAVDVVSDGISQAIAIAELLLTSIGQESHGRWNLRTNRTNLPETRCSFSCGGCMLASLFIDEAHASITVRKSQTFNELGHLSAEEMTRSFVSA